MTTITKTITANTIDTHPNPEAVYEWVRSNWHDLNDHNVCDFEEALKAFAEWHGVKVDYAISAVPDRSEYIRFSAPIDYTQKPADWEDCPLTGSMNEYSLWMVWGNDDLIASLDTLHDDTEYTYSDEGLADFLEDNGHYFLDDGSFCPEVEAVA